MEMAIENEITQFLKQNFPLSPRDFSLNPNGSLIEAGVIDSTGVLELIEFIESQYHIPVPDEDVLPENLDSIVAITRYIAARIAKQNYNGHG
jgi:acyl carrier protein